jgi:hypothetical protein
VSTSRFGFREGLPGEGMESHTSLLGIIIVDYWLIYRAVEEIHGVSQGKFYEQLATALIENK